MEYLLFASFRLCRLFNPEDSGKIICLCVSISGICLVFYYQIHLGIVDEGLVQMYSFMFPQSIKGELCNYIFSSEECIDLYACRVKPVLTRVSVYDCDVLQDQSGEWLEVDLFKGNVSFELFGKGSDDLVCDEGLHLRHLDCQCSCKQETGRCHDDTPEYFYQPFYNPFAFCSPTCKNSKNIGENPYFCRCKMSIKHALYVRNYFRNRVIV